ncbi:CBS domain-containing protein [Nocardioides luteus]|uniref:Signal transduction protein n=1 Tax=Nocardioides luteus TaxID=1844 RepID=A0ABQ5SX26_9ACTN|nr:CBS domain-containing protein [Nocardioides luteus]MDR7311814.1 CBS domain-containing protein [Nocardioides luteus]GGR71710.1 signal transduction protein [Nocardioides luteus]GLJ68057.1 signal transduction protein [Nocardioides luteus]
MKIADVLSRKAIAEVVTIAPTATVRDLLGLLAEHSIGACVVASDDDAVTGIVSERDVVRRLHENDGLLTAEVSSIMTAEVETCDPEATIDDILGVMTQRRIRHMPVVSADGNLVGIVSIGDLVKHRIDQLAFERDQLEAYVHQT